jgi:uncharacterized membrane protein YkvA (DUF1232 family)
LTDIKSSKKPSKTLFRKTTPTKKRIEKVIEKTKSKAEEYARDPDKAKQLLDDAVKKTKSYEKYRGPFAEVWGYLTALFRLLRAYIRKDYRDIPWGSIVLVIVAIIYFVWPIDLIADFLPVIGLTDDAAIIASVVVKIKADLDNFMAWEVSGFADEDSAESNEGQPA